MEKRSHSAPAPAHSLNALAPGVLRRIVLYTFFISLAVFVGWTFFGEQGPPRSYFRTTCSAALMSTVLPESECGQSAQLLEMGKNQMGRYLELHALSDAAGGTKAHTGLSASHPWRDSLLDAALNTFERITTRCKTFDNAAWFACPVCADALYYQALTLLKLKKANDAIAVTKQANSNQQKSALYGRVRMIQAFAAELQGESSSVVEAAFKEALQLNPALRSEYMGVIRESVPRDASKEELSAVVHLGEPGSHNAQAVTLLELLLAKEFLNNAFFYAILDPNEPAKYQQNKYLLLSHLISPYVRHVLARLYDQLISSKQLPFKDEYSTRFYAYNERVSRFVQAQLHPVVEHVVSKSIKPSFTYFGGYVAGSEVKPHTDRAACEYSLALLVDESPNAQWTMGLGRVSQNVLSEEYAVAEMPVSAEQINFRLHPADALLLQGREKVHYRQGPLAADQYSRLLYLHYVPLDSTHTT